MASEGPPQQRVSAADWAAIIGQEDCENIVGDILDQILDNSQSVIYERYIESQLLPYTVKRAKKAIMQLIEWQFLRRDPGEIGTDTDPTWLEDEEPRPATIDSWARGAIPVKKAPPPAVASQSSTREMHRSSIVRPSASTVGKMRQQSSAELGISRAHRDSAGSGSDAGRAGKGSAGAQLVSVSEGTVPPAEPAAHDEHPPAPPAEDGAPEAAAAEPAVASPTKSRTTKPRDAPPAQRSGPVRGALLRKSKEGASSERQGKAHPGAGTSAAAKSVDGQQQAAEGSPNAKPAAPLPPSHVNTPLAQPPSTVGFASHAAPQPPARRDVVEGTVVGAMRFDPSKLPSYRVHTKASVVDSAADTEAARIKAARARRRMMMSQQQPAGADAAARSLPLTDRAASYQDRVDERGMVPSLLESIQLAPGVTIREGDKVRRGPEVSFVAKPPEARGRPAQRTDAVAAPIGVPGAPGTTRAVKFGGEPLPPVPSISS